MIEDAVAGDNRLTHVLHRIDFKSDLQSKHFYEGMFSLVTSVVGDVNPDRQEEGQSDMYMSPVLCASTLTYRRIEADADSILGRVWHLVK